MSLERAGVVMTCVSLLGGCTMWNPDFGRRDVVADGDESEEGEGASEGSREGSSEGATSSSGGDEASSEEASSEDTAPPACPVMKDEAYAFAYSNGGPCGYGEAKHYVKASLSELNFAPGIAMGQHCANDICTVCEGSQVFFGSPNMGALGTIWSELGEIIQQNTFYACLEIEVETFVGEDADYCYFETAALAVRKPDLGTVFFGANNEAMPTYLGGEVMEGEVPTLGEPIAGCPCEDFHYGDPDEVECCEQEGAPEAQTFGVDVFGETVEPGDGGQIFMFNLLSSWTFEVAQAQKIPHCGEGPDEGLSWTMTRTSLLLP